MWKLIALVLIVVLWILALVDRVRHPTVTVSFEGREPVSDADFGKRYFPDHADLAVTLRTLMADKMGTDMSRVMPDDPLWAEGLLGDDLDGVEYLMSVEDSFLITIPDDDAEALCSFRDLVVCVERLIREQKAD